MIIIKIILKNHFRYNAKNYTRVGTISRTLKIHEIDLGTIIYSFNEWGLWNYENTVQKFIANKQRRDWKLSPPIIKRLNYYILSVNYSK